MDTVLHGPHAPATDGSTSGTAEVTSPATRSSSLAVVPGEDTASACENPALYTFPVDGAEEVYGGGAVWFLLTEPDPTAQIVVTDADGAAVAGDTVSEGAVVSWTGATRAANEMYVATLTTACGVSIVEFTIGDIGQPLTVDPSGWGYTVELARGAWLEPWELGQVLDLAPLSASILVMPELVDGGVDVVAGSGTSARQDECAATRRATADSWTDPTFAVSLGQLQILVAGERVPITDVTVSGSFASDASLLALGRLTGVVDVRDLVVALDLTAKGDAACMMLDPLASGCAPCVDGTANCLPVAVDGLYGVTVDFPIVEQTDEDIANDASCL